MEITDNHGYVKMVDFGFSKRMEVYVNSLQNILRLNLKNILRLNFKWKIINHFTELSPYSFDFRMEARRGHSVVLQNMLRQK